MDAAETQRLVTASPLRVKFQNVAPDGSEYAGSGREYPFFWDDPPDGWRVDGTSRVETPGGPSLATVLRSDGGEVLVAVEHETGLEIVLPVLAPIAAKAASTAAVAVVEWAWSRWRKRRADLDQRETVEPYGYGTQPPRNSQLRVERGVRPDGTPTETVVVDNPSTDVLLAALAGRDR
jgi:hypothetical protein